jgi:Domain of unknown function (DUF4416)
MERVKRREDAILFVGSLFSSEDIFASVQQALTGIFGAVLFKGPALPWNFSGYYNDELQPPILRNFLFFETIIDPPCLVDAKLAALEMERKFSDKGRRLINLDPGYLTLAKVVLASKKNYSHRINLGKGVFAELELFFRNGRFNPMPYTYNDYRDKQFLDIFTWARELLKKSLEQEQKKAQGGKGPYLLQKEDLHED